MKYNNVARERTIPAYKDSLYHWGFVGSDEEGYLAFDSEGLPYISSGSGGGSVTPSTLVVSETTYGQSSVVGTSLLYARQDHSHGTPALPTLGALGAEAAGTASGLMSTHTGSSDPHTQYQKESEKGNANGYASLDSFTLVPSAQLPVATTTVSGIVELATSAETTSGLAVQASDTRLSDSRHPAVSSEAHGDLIYRGSSLWERLAPGTTNQILTTQGSANSPIWQSIESLLVGLMLLFVTKAHYEITEMSTLDVEETLIAEIA